MIQESDVKNIRLDGGVGDVLPETILKARIALLATAIGGPDHSSEQEPPPYRLGDDCLACLKDLRRWFTLVDEKQRRWDVARAAAEFKILVDDLIPILADWEERSAKAVKQSRRSGGTVGDYFRNKGYYDKVALNAFQLVVWMTWPIMLTDESSQSHIANYSDLKKHQLIYKKMLLSSNGGKVVKAAIRLASDIIRIDRLQRSPRDNALLRLVLNFLRNILAIEPSEVTISSKQRTGNRGVSAAELLPPNVSMDDISLNNVVSTFQRSKVFAFLLTISSSINSEFDAEYVKIPLLEIIFYLTKDLSHDHLFKWLDSSESSLPATVDHQNKGSSVGHRPKVISRAGEELNQLLVKERDLKRSQIRISSTRHSRFGGFFSIQTPDNVRLTVSNSHNILDQDAALKTLDNRKKWNKAVRNPADIVQGVPISFLNSAASSTYVTQENAKCLKRYLDGFITSSFNILFKLIADHFTTDESNHVMLNKIHFLLSYSWFLKYHRISSEKYNIIDPISVSQALQDTCYILLPKFLRESYEQKNWAVVHAALLAITELLMYLNQLDNPECEDTVDDIMSRMFSDENIKLLSNIPKSASSHSPQYVRACVNLNDTIFKTIEKYERNNKTLTTKSFGRYRGGRFTAKMDSSANEASKQGTAQNEDQNNEESSNDDSDIEEKSTFRMAQINFQKVLNAYIYAGTIDTYVKFLQRYQELEGDDIKKVMRFLNYVTIDVQEETFLFRIDFIILLKDMLSPNGLDYGSKNRKYVLDFATHFMSRLKEKLKKAPSWYVNLLFPNLHDRQLGHYMRYGEHKPIIQGLRRVACPTQFKPSNDHNSLSGGQPIDFKLGILVSTLIDEGKRDFVTQIHENFTRTLESYKEVAGKEIHERLTYPRSDFRSDMCDMKRALLFDGDIRALVLLLGYHLPFSEKEQCYMGGQYNLLELDNILSVLGKYLLIPFHTPNGLQSSSYLVRPTVPRGGIAHNDTVENLTDYPVNDSQNIKANDKLDDYSDRYFQDLERIEERLAGKKLPKGTAKAKAKANSKKGKKSKVKQFGVNDEHLPRNIDKKLQIVSKELISDSDDEDNLLLNPIFYENEMYLRFLLDKHNGQLPADMFAAFSRFSNERLQNGGTTVGDYSTLFNGPVPQLGDITSHDKNGSRSTSKYMLEPNTRNKFDKITNDSDLRDSPFNDDGLEGSKNIDVPLSDFEYDSTSPSNSIPPTDTVSTVSVQVASVQLPKNTKGRSYNESDSDDAVVPRKKLPRLMLSDDES
ncbi:Tof1p Ecym_1083 [Eremothecium cymbalariae DBVPG|uniref:Topoisomerase 1-associated factor 1 n=1 Tax=Eremothecium cymbalariae (strain CBS 270.75 / DBVPG 7215 / KCTC 17166 / NRRL Y-17582) TaxID=931890 RepID=G8JMD1_ERECY|nr:hypothetical protein Ecym_1083 [Eremothecium cymbalariae DBVPG\